MTVRVFMKPNELGEAGYHIDFEQADDYHRRKSGALALTFTADDGEEYECAQVQADRWDAAELLAAASDV